MGRLTREPDFRYGGANGDMAIAKYSIAVERRRKKDGEPEADFFNLISFGRQAEFVRDHLRKGTKIFIEGEARNDNYTNKNGEKVYGMSIVVSTVDFAESRAAAERNGNDYQPGQGGSQDPAYQETRSQPADGFYGGVQNGEELPF